MSRSINFCCWPHQLQWCPGLWILFPSVFQYLFFMLSWMLYFILISNRFPLCLFLGFISHVGSPVSLIMPCPFSLFLGDEAFCFSQKFVDFTDPLGFHSYDWFCYFYLFLVLSSFQFLLMTFLHCDQFVLLWLHANDILLCNIMSSFLLQLFCIQSPSWLFTIHLRSSLYHTLILYCEISIMLSMNFDCLLCMGV